MLSILFLVLGVLVPALYVGGWVLSEAGFNVPLSTANGIPMGLLRLRGGDRGRFVAGRSDRRFDGRRLGRRGAIPGRRHRRNRFCRRGNPRCRRTGGHLGSNGPARTSLLLSSHHGMLPWVGMVAFALSIGFWNKQYEN